jgi:hypothetical protein
LTASDLLLKSHPAPNTSPTSGDIFQKLSTLQNGCSYIRSIADSTSFTWVTP